MKPRRRRLAVPEALDNILDRSGENRFARTKLPFPRETWVRAVGARIADRTLPLKLENGELLVLVATSVWSNELAMLANDVLTRLVALGVPAVRLRFRVGQIDVDRPPERRARRKVPPAVRLPASLDAVVGALEDHDLMKEIRLAAETSLAWRERRERGPTLEETAPVAPTLPAAGARTDRQGPSSTTDPESGPRSRAGARHRRP